MSSIQSFRDDEYFGSLPLVVQKTTLEHRNCNSVVLVFHKKLLRIDTCFNQIFRSRLPYLFLLTLFSSKSLTSLHAGGESHSISTIKKVYFIWHINKSNSFLFVSKTHLSFLNILSKFYKHTYILVK